MKRKIYSVIGPVIIMASILVLAGCSGGASGQGGPYRPTSIVPTVSNDTVTIPESVITTRNNVEFNVKFDQGTASYMAYYFKNAVQVRASVCVPCQGKSFTLSGNTLICGNCGTVFDATTGKGVKGVKACQGYPKAAVPFTTSADGLVTLKKADLLKAYTDTLAPGLP